MDKMLSILKTVNPAYGIKEVEFSPNEVKRFRADNLDARNTGSARKSERLL